MEVNITWQRVLIEMNTLQVQTKTHRLVKYHYQCL